jgi:hypothetical protein
MGDADFELAQEQRDFAFEHERRPGQARHRFHAGEQARKALDLGLHVGFAALDDHLVGATAGDDLLRAFGEVRRRAEHAHRVVVRQHHVLDRLVRDRADLGDQVLRHGGRGGGVDDHHAVVADDHAGIGVALGRVGVGVFGKLGEGDLLGFQVGLGCECFCHVCLFMGIVGSGMGILGIRLFLVNGKFNCYSLNIPQTLVVAWPAPGKPSSSMATGAPCEAHGLPFGLFRQGTGMARTPGEGSGKTQRGIQSVEVGGRLLQALADARVHCRWPNWRLPRNWLGAGAHLSGEPDAAGTDQARARRRLLRTGPAGAAAWHDAARQ